MSTMQKKNSLFDYFQFREDELRQKHETGIKNSVLDMQTIVDENAEVGPVKDNKMNKRMSIAYIKDLAKMLAATVSKGAVQSMEKENESFIDKQRLKKLEMKKEKYEEEKNKMMNKEIDKYLSGLHF